MRYVFSLIFLLIISNTTWSQTVEYPPADLSFIIGVTPSAPAAGSDTLVLQGASGWNVRLYRGKLKQSTSNDGSGIYYVKNLNSDTLKLIGDKWHSGELVQLEFYRSNGNVSFSAPSTIVEEAMSFALNSPTGTPVGSPGSINNPQNWVQFYSTKEATGTNSYIQFVPNSPTNSGMFWVWLKEDSTGKSYNLTINSGTNDYEVSYNGGATIAAGVVNLKGKFVKFKRSGSAISIEYASTANGTPTQLYTFSTPIGNSANIALGAVLSHEPSYMHITNAKISGASIHAIN